MPIKIQSIPTDPKLAAEGWIKNHAEWSTGPKNLMQAVRYRKSLPIDTWIQINGTRLTDEEMNDLTTLKDAKRLIDLIRLNYALRD